MTFKLPALIASAAIGAALSMAPAEAQSQRRTFAPRPSQHTVFTSRDESGRTRTRILVTPRSYLDGGTEVLPGQRKYSDYVTPPYYSPLENALGPGRGFDRQPLNSRWESGGVRTW